MERNARPPMWLQNWAALNSKAIESGTHAHSGRWMVMIVTNGVQQRWRDVVFVSKRCTRKDFMKHHLGVVL